MYCLLSRYGAISSPINLLCHSSFHVSRRSAYAGILNLGDYGDSNWATPVDALSNPVHPWREEVEEDLRLEGDSENGFFEFSHNGSHQNIKSTEWFEYGRS